MRGVRRWAENGAQIEIDTNPDLNVGTRFLLLNRVPDVLQTRLSIVVGRIANDDSSLNTTVSHRFASNVRCNFAHSTRASISCFEENGLETAT